MVIQLVRFFLVAFILIPVCCIFAQDGPVSQMDLDLQSAFIDANREVILGNYDKAEPLFADLARKHPSNDAFAYALVRIFAAKEDYAAALTEIRRARVIDSKNTWYAVTEGELLEKTSQFAAAATLYQQLAKEHPKEEAYYVQWAFYMIRDGKPDEAIKVYDRMEKVLGSSQDISRKKYLIYRGMGKQKEATAVLEAVIARQPDNTEAMYTLAEFLTESGAVEDARKWYQRILKQHPGETEAQLRLVQLTNPARADEGESLEGLAVIFGDPNADLDQKIKAIIPHIQEFANTADPTLGKQLEDLTRQLQKAHPNESKVPSIQGDLAYYRGDLDTAIRFYRQSVMQGKAVYSVWEQLLRSCSEAHYVTDQLELARQALDLFPNQPRIHFYLAEAATALHLYQDAQDAINMGRLIARKDGYLLYHLAILEGFIHAEQGQQTKADLAFDTALQLNPRSPEALAMRSLAQADPRQKCRFAEEAAAVDARMPVVRFALAQCAFFNSNYALSKTSLLPLAEKPYPHPAWLEMLGDTYAMMGDMNNAVLFWEKTDKSGAGSARLKEKLIKRQYIE